MNNFPPLRWFTDYTTGWHNELQYQDDDGNWHPVPFVVGQTYSANLDEDNEPV
jgi:hypothetical protein